LTEQTRLDLPLVSQANGQSNGTPIPLHAVTKQGTLGWRGGLDPAGRRWLDALGFDGTAGKAVALPGPDGAVALAVVGLGDGDDPLCFAAAAESLPVGEYALVSSDPIEGWETDIALAWALSAYAFTRYRKAPETPKAKALLIWPEGADEAYVRRLVEATFLIRDLVNTPAEDMGPAELANVANGLALRHGAGLEVIVGEGLLRANYPLIHAVGRASHRDPRLIDMTWGDPRHPMVTLVGKGVCFDSGGLDIKPSAGMRLMKKDMGGAAHVLGLASMVMDQGLPVRLRVLIPAVDNAIDGSAFRPGDVLRSRKGLSVEIGNTDAEGRLVLADALAEACAESPQLLIDCATLTGAARVALGPDVPALFTDDDGLADRLAAQSKRTRDPLWRLPLWPAYRRMIDSKVADINNAGDSPFAGSITAALFLKDFISPGVSWVHLDLYAWRPTPRPGQSEGGAAQALRALHGLLVEKFGTGQE
jgi:leucyl aminopeptidase